ncbi:hypothetical protein [Rhodoferax sp.]|uniref:hypothetical protein n=1 Tax=Rhodoferax sp. TaxID=50421 RepID=UPI0027584FEB|nr:hypothetical protein [Rhodoferax sp.]
MTKLLVLAFGLFLAGCTSTGGSLFNDNGADIVEPVSGDQFLPAVGYMPACNYANTTGNFITRNRDNAVLEEACNSAVGLLKGISGFSLKQPVGLPVGLRSRAAARQGGEWIDRPLEIEREAKYRVIISTPSIGSDGPGSKYIQFGFTFQRIADGKIMRVMPRSGGLTNATAAAIRYATDMTKILNNPVSMPPQWHSPF